jgi:hypothetical protein
VTLTSSEEEEEELPTYRGSYWSHSSRNSNAIEICAEQLRTNKIRMKQIKDILYYKNPDRIGITKTFENVL